MSVLSKLIFGRSFLLMVVLFVPSARGLASFHQDIEVSGQGSAIKAGFCSEADHGCDIVGVEHLGLPPNTVPTDFETGKDIYVTAFTHFVFSGQHSTDNPGFQSTAGSLLSSELVSYQALGVLEFWNPAIGAWSFAPDNVKLRLAGGLKITEVADQNCGLVFCPPRVTTETSFTTFTANGVTGAASLIVGQAAANGSFHSHLDWFLETSSGAANGGPQGAYLVEMRLSSDKRQTPSDSFYILFNNQLPAEQFQSAVSQRVLGSESPQDPQPPVPEPEVSAWKAFELATSDLLGDEPIALAAIGNKAYLIPEDANKGLAVLDSSASLDGKHSGAFVNGKLYVFDAEAGATRVFEIESSDFVEKESLAAMPTIRFGATAMVTDNDEVFVFGGKQTRSNGASRMINRLESFNPETNEWKRHRNIPGINRREGAALAAVSIDGKTHAYLLGGGVLQKNRLFGAIAAYDFDLNRWQTRAMTPMPTPRVFQSGIQAPVLDGKIYLIGGRSVNSAGGLSKSDKVEIYDPVSNTWQIGPNLPKVIAEPLSFTVDGKIYVIDAGQQPAQSAITAWELDSAWKPSLEEDQTCDLDGDGRFTNRDVNLFARACRAETSYWNCDLTEEGASIARNIREYRLQWWDYRNQTCP
ncbi:kelch repeat-containing protein [Methylotuvimicrobium sp. KM2]|uniref:Kelch repeat-containing protein n=1 Tax=Methylotuvimicrobium sp. KM2 TaxID=3133976 RepID=UPI003100DBA9